MSANTGPIYSHRPMQPNPVRTSTTPGPPPQRRVSVMESLEIIRMEYEALQSEFNGVRSQRDELEVKLEAQVLELNSLRSTLCELEIHHSRLRADYEEYLRNVQSETSRRRTESSGRHAEPISHTPSRSPHIPEPSTSTSSTPRFDAQSRRADPYQSLPSSLSRVDGVKHSRMYDEPDCNPEPSSDHRDPKRHKSRRDYMDAGYGPLPMGTRALITAGPSTSAKRMPSPTNSVGQHSGSPESSANANKRPKRVSKRTGTHKDLTLDTVPPEFKKEGINWHVLYNPKIKKALDINLVHTFTHSTVVCCVQFSPDGRLLATGCNRTTQIYDVQTGSKMCILEDETASRVGDHYIRSVKFSPDGKWLVTGAEDRNIRIWDISKRRLLHTLRGHTQEIYSIDFSRDSRWIVSGSADATLSIWDMHTNSSQIIHIPLEDVRDGGFTYVPGFTSVAISPDSKFVAAGSLDTGVRIYELATGRFIAVLDAHDDSVYSVAYTPDGRGIITGSLDQSLMLWDVTSILDNSSAKAKLSPKGTSTKDLQPPLIPEPAPFDGHGDYVLSASITPDSRWIISGSKDRSVSFWDARSTDLQFILHGHKNSVIAVHVSPLGGMIATGSGDHTARIWTYSSL